MERTLYVMLMENQNPLDAAVVRRHVDHLKGLDASGKLVLCGPFTDTGGGMVVLNSATFEEADAICRSDPYISESYKTYVLKTLAVAEKENGYRLG